MSKQVIAAAFCVAVFVVLGLAGAVEHGASLSRFSLVIPVLAALVLAMNKCEKKY